MKVTCNLCQFEKGGFCTKKKQSGKPKKIKLTKRRSCDLYQEDAMKVFDGFRKREAHKAALKQQELRRARTAALIKKLREDGING